MNRFALLKLLALMLYAGPLVAGLAGQGWGVVPAFVAVFVLWQVVMRPADWPRDAARWTQPAQMLAALARVALLVALVALMFGIGRGIGGVAGHLPAVPPYLPLALSFLSVPLSRMLYDPAKAAEMDAFLTDALSQINAIGRETEDEADLSLVIEPLLLLPDDAPDATARAGVGAILSDGDTPARTRTLVYALQDAPGRHGAVRRGLILWATERPVAETNMGLCLPSEAFKAAGDDPGLLRLFADNALPLIAGAPELWGDYPMTDLVREAATRSPDAGTARMLAALADAQDAARAEVYGAADD